MTRVYLIRHGRPAAAWGGDEVDPGLDEVGAEQANGVARALLARPVGQRPTHVASSPMRRCRETARPLSAALGVPIEIVPAISEVPTPSALDAQARPLWLKNAMGGRWRDIVGELDYDAWRRCAAAAVALRPGTALFSHFVAINAVLSVLAGCDDVISFRPGHASITCLEVGPSGLSLVHRGDEAATAVL